MRALRRLFLIWTTCLPLWVGAHAHLLNTEPPANSIIDQPPFQLRLRFSEPSEKRFVRIKVIADTQTVSMHSDHLQWDASSKTLLINLPTLHASNYEVQWSILAKDGHTSRGQFVFKVKSP